MSPEEQELINKIIYTAFIVPTLLSALLIWFMVFYQKKRHSRTLEKKESQLREQQLIIDKKEALQKERDRIASEMHDDLGSGLTTIRFLSERAIKSTVDVAEREKLENISQQSQKLVSNMSEIIWAMNSRFDNSESTFAYIRRYAAEYCAVNEKKIQFDFLDDESENIITGEQRRNLFLIIKEILHNMVKYSKANNCCLTGSIKNNKLECSILEVGGVGFKDQTDNLGNGLRNIQNRIDKIDGQIQYSKSKEGFLINIQFPLKNEDIEIQ